MSSKSTLHAKNLEALGAERLAQLLIEISTGDAAAKRKVRRALAGHSVRRPCQELPHARYVGEISESDPREK